MNHPDSLRAGGLRALLMLFLLGTSPLAAMNFQLLHSFDVPPDGPWAGLVRGGDGNFYGVTDGGGAEQNGTIFRVSSNGTVTVVHHMRGSEGTGPEGRLALGANGWLYGTTYFGGP